MKQTFFIILAAALFFSSCTKEKSLELTFSNSYKGEQVELGKNYSLDDGTALTFLKSEMFISDLVLVDKDGKERPVQDVFLLKFEGKDLSYSFSDVDVENLDKIKFGIGVNKESNAKKPEDFSVDSPLREGGYYWEAWKSYIFTKTEGKVDTTGDGVAKLGYVFHTGSDEVYTTYEADISDFSLSDDKLKLHVDFDMHAQMHPNGKVRDIKSNPVIHTGNIEVLKELVQIMKNSTKVTNE